MSLSEIYLRDCELQGWQPDINHQIVLQHIHQIFYPERSFFSKLFHPSKILGCYIWGDVGRGKTYLMDLFFNNTPIDRKCRYHFTAFMQMIHQQLRHQRGDILAVAKQLRRNYDLICLDEFQVSEIADAMILARLFESLFDQGIHFVTTSNTKPDGLYRNGLHFERFSPFIGVLKDNLEIVQLESQNNIDYRRRETGSNEKFDTTTYAKLRDRFLQKANAEGKTGLNFHIHQRTIYFPDASPSTLWVEFKDICDVPYGAAEYQAIAHQVKEVFLVNVPILIAEARDSTRRFITLIDCLYDEEVTLYLHAAESPDHLYQDNGKSGLPFDRTASRLIQMGKQTLPNT